MAVFVTLFVALTVAPRARAQNVSEAMRLFTEARELMKSGNVTEACARFEASLKAGAGTGTMLYLGDCYEKIGRPASAYAMYRGAEGLARANQDEREKIAHDLAAKLEPSIAWLTLHFVHERPRGYELRRDGVVLGASDLDASMPIDPGEHGFEARAIGKVPWTGKLTVPSGQARLTLDVPDLRDVPPPPARVITRASNAQRVVGGLVAGLGLAAIGVGTFFGIEALDKNDQSNSSGCDATTNICTNARAMDLRSTAVDYARVADITLGVGVAAIVGGVIVFLAAPRSRSSTAAIVQPRGVSLIFRF
jgi:hypothetical protein